MERRETTIPARRASVATAASWCSSRPPAISRRGPTTTDGADIYLRDRQTRVTRRISVAVGDEETDGPSSVPAISADARWIAFTSAATNLVSTRDANGGPDVFLFEVATGRAAMATVLADGSQAPRGQSFGPSLSADGSVMAFVSTADFSAVTTGCLTSPGQTAAPSQVYVRDNKQGSVRCVDADLLSKGRGRAHSASLSPDGRFVAFVFDGQSRGNLPQVYLYDRERSQTSLVSRTKNGAPANGGSARPAVSAGGRFVAFESLASNLECGRHCPVKEADVNLLPDVYLADVEAGLVRRLSTGGAPGEWWVPSVAPAIAGSGRSVAFSSRQPRTPDDVDTRFDVYLWATPDAQP